MKITQGKPNFINEQKAKKKWILNFFVGILEVLNSTTLLIFIVDVGLLEK
jgi:hypothetical protein